jgi:predicted metal-dependent hydrolase
VNENSPIEYKLRVAKRARRLSLRYDHRGLHIITPRSISDRQAQDLISKHKVWIRKQQDDYATTATRKLHDGIELEIFGDREKVRYVLEENISKVTESGEHLLVKASAGEHEKGKT